MHMLFELSNDLFNSYHAITLSTPLQIPSYSSPRPSGSCSEERTSEPAAAHGGHSSPRQARRSALIEGNNVIDVHSCSPTSAARTRMTTFRTPQSHIPCSPLNHVPRQSPEAGIAKQTNGLQRTHGPPQLVLKRTVCKVLCISVYTPKKML